MPLLELQDEYSTDTSCMILQDLKKKFSQDRACIKKKFKNCQMMLSMQVSFFHIHALLQI